MKALSLTQPWASLLALGCKTIETRDWNTQFRGWFAIHASKQFPSDARDFAYTSAVIAAMEDARKALTEQRMLPNWLEDWHKTSPENHPTGKIVGVAYLANAERTINVFDAEGRPRLEAQGYQVHVLTALSGRMLNFRDVPKHERIFGDYRNRGDAGSIRHALWTTHAIPLLEPIACKGRLGFWDTYHVALQDAVTSGRAMIAQPDEKIDALEDAIYRELHARGIALPMPGMDSALGTRGMSIQEAVANHLQTGDNQ